MRSRRSSRPTPTSLSLSAHSVLVVTPRYVSSPHRWFWSIREKPADPTQTLSSAVALGKTLSKAIYIFSPDEDTGKVAHVNYLPKEILSRKVLDAKVWLGEVSKVLGGKVGLERSCFG
jgi:hypothetical protein